MDEIVKKEFLRRVLLEHKDELEESHSRALRKYLQFHTGETESDRLFSLKMSDEFLSGTISMRVQSHIRFLDIKKRSVKRKDGTIGRRKQRIIYNRIAHRSYFSIARDVMFGLTTEVAEGIKRELKTS